MEPAALLSLPVEVLHNIGKFLPVEDILACSATCHYLRNTFNDNIVWKRYLPKNFKQSLQTQELCVVPVFHLEESLTPLCENRVTFIKKTNLVNNWKNGNFVSHAGKHSYSYSSRGYNVSKAVGQVIYKNHYLFLGRFIRSDDLSLWDASNTIDVWDVNKVPVLIVVLKMNEINNYKHLYIVGDCLVVVVCVQVKVYEINIADKSFPLLFSFLITENDVVFHKSINHRGGHNERCVGWNYSMVDNYLFANKCEDQPYGCSFHIWDIVNSCKVGTFVPPVLGFSIHYHSHIGSNWFLQMMKQSANDVYFFQFDIERKTFSESIFKVNKKSILHSMMYNSFLIFFESTESDSEGWCDTVCTVYDFGTSEKLKERRLNDARTNLVIKSAKVINGQFVMLCNDAFHVVDALTLETLEQFPYENLYFLTHQFSIHGSVFVLAANSHNIYEVWNVSKKEKFSRDLNKIYIDHLYLNESCTKLVCVSYCDVAVYHFL